MIKEQKNPKLCRLEWGVRELSSVNTQLVTGFDSNILQMDIKIHYKQNAQKYKDVK